MQFTKDVRFKHHVKPDLFDAQNLPTFNPGEDRDEQIGIIQREIAVSDRLMVNRAINQEHTKNSLKPIDREVTKLLELKKKQYPTTPQKYRVSTPLTSRREAQAQSDSKQSAKEAAESKEKTNVVLTQRLHRELVASSHSMQTIKLIMKRLFSFYVSFGDRLNTSFIRTAQVFRILEEANITSRNIDQHDVEILFYKHSNDQASIDFYTFLDLMIDIAEMKFSDLKEQEALMRLFEKHLKPLYASIYINTDVGEHDIIFKQPLEKKLLQVLWNAEKVLKNIYKKCFPLEFVRGTVEDFGLRTYIQKSDNAYFSFLKDFNISPSLIGKSLANSLFQEIVETSIEDLTYNPVIPNVLADPESDCGRRLTFSRFLVIIARLALISYSAKNSARTTANFANDLEPVQKLLLLMERMEFSNGFFEYERALNVTHNQKDRILPSKAFIIKLLDDKPEDMQRYSIISRDSSPESRRLNSQERYYPSGGLSQSPERRSISSINSDRKSISPARKSVSPGRLSLIPERAMREHKLSPQKEKKRPAQVREKKVDPSVKLRAPAKRVIDSRKDALTKIFKHFSVLNSTTGKYYLSTLKLLNLLKQAHILQEGAGRDAACLSTIDIDIICSKVCATTVEEEAAPSTGGKAAQKATYFQPGSAQKTAAVHTRKEPATSKKFEYDQLLKIIELAAEKMFPLVDLGTATEIIITQHFSQVKVVQGDAMQKLAEALQSLNQFISLLGNPEMNDILKRLINSMRSYYQAYADPLGQINIEGFTRFAKDFGLFPELIPKEKVLDLFAKFTMVYPVLKSKRTEQTKELEDTPRSHNTDSKPKLDPAELADNNFVDLETFSEVLISCSTLINIKEGSNKHPIEKVAFLLEMMSQSPGPKSFYTTRLSPFSYFEVYEYIRYKYRGILGIKDHNVKQEKKGDRLRRVFDERSHSRSPNTKHAA